ncbi:DUF1349 domain-containing protein [Streptomyces heilongjiangensis]|uniref:DUF1349 domain-containing protein n=1 Tax=Streptomyces heilongjiangensis TaxID=945052 RepID=A0ABW1BCW0_9ACTN|nr:DUF1349 domain-containing protein [Streptomyces heilongjiangensis]MDC2949777.1 DUF1349 domain-containing protein [Streptomyces heilongjiangensis]
MNISVPFLPFALASSSGTEWQVDGDRIEVTSSPQTDYFIDPGYTEVPDEYTRLNADTLLGELPASDFSFAARVSVDFQSTFDAGVLLLWQDDRTWAKLCFEYSPSEEGMVVSVVARDFADDANAFDTPARSIWLRIARMGRVIALHASLDGKRWRMVRVFTFGAVAEPMKIGFLAQSPNGAGCHVVFDHISYAPEAPKEIRDGA